MVSFMARTPSRHPGMPNRASSTLGRLPVRVPVRRRSLARPVLRLGADVPDQEAVPMGDEAWRSRRRSGQQGIRLFGDVLVLVEQVVTHLAADRPQLQPEGGGLVGSD